MEIFLHIPKTAGTTLNHVLRHQYPAPGAIFHVDHPDPRQAARRFHSLEPQRQRAARLLRGHIHFGLHRHLDEPASYFTLLRDPVERVISHYYHVRNRPSHHAHTAVVSGRMTLKDYVACGAYTELDNGQTRMLAGLPGLPDQTRFGRCDEDLLALAEKNLDEHFGAIGIQERFDETLLLFRAAYGWATPYYVTSNVTLGKPRHDEVPDDTLDVIRHFNRIDLRLYARVSQRFSEEVASRGPAFAAERQRFQAANARYSQVYRGIERAESRTQQLLKILFRTSLP